MQSAGNSNSVLVKLVLRLNIYFVFGFAQVKDAESRSPAKVQEAVKGGAVAVSQLQDLQSEKDLITAKANDHLQRLEPLAGQLQVLYNQVTEVERFRAYISWINKVESVRSVDRRFEERCKIGGKFSPKLQSGDHNVSVKSARRNVFFLWGLMNDALCVLFSVGKLRDCWTLVCWVQQWNSSLCWKRLCICWVNHHVTTWWSSLLTCKNTGTRSSSTDSPGEKGTPEWSCYEFDFHAWGWITQ